MKKSLIYTSVCGLALFAGSLSTVIINNASAETVQNNPTVALEQTLTTKNSIVSKNETIYAITDSAGGVKNVFINSTLDTSAANLPLEAKITYTLDGSEISAEDLIGKSGRVKINYTFTSTKTFNGSKVPFLTITGTVLDGNKFKNVSITNGKIISENNDSITLAGYAVVGLNENLGTDILPASFTIEADVTDFAMNETYSLATNELFAEIDTSKLNSLDDLIDQMNELASGLDQLIAGAESLSTGLDSAVSGVAKLQSGAQKLNSGTAELSAGLTELSANNDTLNAGAEGIFSSLLTTTENTLNSNTTLTALIQNYGQSFGITTPISLTSDNYKATFDSLINFLTSVQTMTQDEAGKQAIASAINSLKAGLTSLTQVNSFVSGLKTYTDGVASAATGAATLSAGTAELATGLDSLASGVSQLADGSKTLVSGLDTFKTSGIDKLVAFANDDLSSALANLRASVSAAKSYHSYNNSSAESVKFIFKTPSLKK